MRYKYDVVECHGSNLQHYLDSYGSRGHRLIKADNHDGHWTLIFELVPKEDCQTALQLEESVSLDDRVMMLEGGYKHLAMRIDELEFPLVKAGNEE
uniref:Uncharacterized protein n=1 Tax=viral metagenome TaxID=1070528 RepID=A0A6M3LP14_9ZZZZ